MFNIANSWIQLHILYFVRVLLNSNVYIYRFLWMYKTSTSSYASKGFDFCLKSCLISNASYFYQPPFAGCIVTFGICILFQNDGFTISICFAIPLINSCIWIRFPLWRHLPGQVQNVTRDGADYENQEWPRVPDRKISVEGDMLWHNPNRGVSRGLDVKACRPRLISSDLEPEVILDSFFPRGDAGV